MSQDAVKRNRFPDFIIIGSGRSGTTSLYYYLRQHPEICMSPIKETNFFAYDPLQNRPLENMDAAPFPIKDVQAYHQLFKKNKNEWVAGEISPRYLWHPTVPKNISQHIPGVKLIAILRNPVDRAYSSFWLHASQRQEKRTFTEAIADEEKLKKNGKWPLGHKIYISPGFYYHHLCQFLKYFPKEQVQIIFYEDFKNNTLKTVQSIFKYIGVTHSFIPNTDLKINASGRPRIKFIQHLFRSRPLTKKIRHLMPGAIHDPIFNLLMKIKDQNLTREPMAKEIRRYLNDIYHDDIIQLQTLVNRDLSHWLRE